MVKFCEILGAHAESFSPLKKEKSSLFWEATEPGESLLLKTISGILRARPGVISSEEKGSEKNPS